MLTGVSRVLTLIAAIGAGLSGGVFLAFSGFVMAAVRRLPDRQGLAAMNEINRQAPKDPIFMLALFGTGALVIALGIQALRQLSHPASKYQLAGAALLLVCIAVTAVYHVPRNNALLLVDPDSPIAPSQWAAYAPAWVAWNHVRTVACLASATSFSLALTAR